MARHAARCSSLEPDAPAGFTAELSERPAHSAAAHAWRPGVAAIEPFRTANGIDDAELERGREPGNELQGPNSLNAGSIDVTEAPPEQHSGVERTEGLARDL